MKKIINYFKILFSLLIVFLGTYLVSFYLTNEISFPSVFVGIIGFFIINPAITKWNKTLWGSENLD